jgi:hypothetical protein
VTPGQAGQRTGQRPAWGFLVPGFVPGRGLQWRNSSTTRVRGTSFTGWENHQRLTGLAGAKGISQEEGMGRSSPGAGDVAKWRTPLRPRRNPIPVNQLLMRPLFATPPRERGELPLSPPSEATPTAPEKGPGRTIGRPAPGSSPTGWAAEPTRRSIWSNENQPAALLRDERKAPYQPPVLLPGRV